VVEVPQIGRDQLNVAVGSVEGLGITREHVKQLRRSLLSQTRVLSIFFQIFLVVIMAIQ